MSNNFYKPINNYERNLLMTKQYCSKLSVLLLPVLLLISIVCSCYLTFLSEQPLEFYLFKVIYDKFGWQFEMELPENILFVVKLLLSVFFIFTLFYIFFTSKNSDDESNPDLGISLLHKYSKLQLVITVLAFVAMVIITIIFSFGDIALFENVGAKLGLSLDSLKIYKVTIVLVLLSIDVILILAIWYAQTQTNFLKSLRMCLYESLPKNKGAHTYGVFSLTISICQFCFAGLCTFLYYCYRDAFAGFGISFDGTYVLVSLTLSYVKGLIFFLIGIDAFMFATTVDEINSYGTLYNDYDILETYETYK